MGTNITITQELVNSIFEYRDGELFYKIKASNKTQIGDKAGTIKKFERGDRWYVIINGKQYKRARIIFFMFNGYFPEIVDHKNRITTDDKIENLRPASRSENSQNKRSCRNSKSKYLGVAKNSFKFLKKNGVISEYISWTALIKPAGFDKQIRLGTFKTEEEAALAYNEAAKKYHKEFANFNIID